jgi:RNA polymerase sigma-70 factor (ECF subfamily)
MDCSAQTIERAVDRFQGGSDREDTFRALFFCYDPVLRRLFQRRGVPPEDSYDLAQKTLFQVYKSLAEFRRESSFHTWIHRIALNFHHRWKARVSRQRSREVSLEPDPSQTQHHSEPEDPGPSPCDEMVTRERKRKLRLCLDELPARQRQCFVLNTYHGLSYREIATAMQIQVGTVGAALSQARANLARSLEETG